MPGKQRPNSEKTKEAKRRNVEKARKELSKIVKRGKEIVSDSEESDSDLDESEIVYVRKKLPKQPLSPPVTPLNAGSELKTSGLEQPVLKRSPPVVSGRATNTALGGVNEDMETIKEMMVRLAKQQEHIQSQLDEQKRQKELRKQKQQEEKDQAFKSLHKKLMLKF